MEGTGVDVPGKVPNKRDELVQIPSPNRGDNSADEHHPDVLQPLHMKMHLSLRVEDPDGWTGKSCRGTERKLASTWRLVNKQG
jgi:hypothetical protein